ncbi:MAG: UDP-2,4-diacetamido-2,4,6-trideoxy-beta-L-altropyranose hydrolase [Candidatus Odinarchaeota archaeon]
MKVYIITEGDSKVGLGHITRCTSLYQAFEEKNINPCFIINGCESIRDLLYKKNFIIFNWIRDKDDLFELIRNADVVIIDSYLIDDLTIQKIAKIVKLPVFIDDTQRVNYPRGFVINGSVHAKDLNYPSSPELHYLLGSNYCMLKRIFWNRPKRHLNYNIKSIMITFGGNDLRNITPKIIKNLNTEYPNIKKNVIIGKYFQNVGEIKKACKKNCNLIYSPDAEGMKEIMLNSDIAITAGGQTTYELVSMGVPAISVAVVNNQIKSVVKLNELNINYYAGWWKDKNLYDKIINFIQELNDVDLRKKMVEIGFKLIKPDGSRKIVENILQYLIMNNFK